MFELGLYILALQGVLGAFDTIYYHELIARLPSKAEAKVELWLHSARDFIYAIVFCTLGWVAWNGKFAWLLILLLLAEIIITLWDFVEEDCTRKLPAGERITHAVMGITYGVFLAYLLPEVFIWLRQPTGFALVKTGIVKWLLTVMGIGVFISGGRDLLSTILSSPKY
ncbi:MAG: hypothetical protein AB1757_17870 [Acidobacteriota bacterium]